MSKLINSNFNKSNAKIFQIDQSYFESQMFEYFQNSFSKSNEQVDVKESSERKKSISNSTLDHKTIKTDFESDKFNFCKHVIKKNVVSIK